MPTLDPAEGWQKRTKDEIDWSVKRRPMTGMVPGDGATIEEILGREVRDAILDEVVP